MPRTRILRFHTAACVVLAVVLAIAEGCSSSGKDPEKSDAEPVARLERPPEQPVARSVPPAADSQPPVTVAEEPKVSGSEDHLPTAPLPSTDSQTPKKPPLRRLPREPFDPIKVNGPIFVGWPKPRLALVITGRQDGYLEPCGCAGLDRMRGGMSRRHTLFENLRTQRGWAVVGINVGGIAKGYGRQAELKFHTSIEGMRRMGYQAITLGKSDLVLPAGELAAEAASSPDDQGPFLSANVGLFGFDAKLTAKFRVVEAAGVKLGVTGVLGKKYQQEINNDEVEMADPEQALAAVVPDLKKRADYLILLAHATMEESLDLAGKFPDFDLVVTAGGAPEPPADAAQINDQKTLLVEVGEKGMDAIVLGMFDNPKRKLRYQRVPLDSRFEASEDMKLLMVGYQDQLKRLGFSGLGIGALPHPQKETLGNFVGSEKCRSCHEPSYVVWRKSGHARAYQTLLDADPPRQFDPECISCHVIGWDPGRFFPYEGGYQSLEKTPKLINVGCESCHGPGSEHVRAEMGSDETLQEKLRKAVVISKAESEEKQCLTCHDLDNSPDFDFKTYWPYVAHYEQEEEE